MIVIQRMKMYRILNKETGDYVPLDAKTEIQAYREAFEAMGLELQGASRICISCENPFTTTDRRYLRCLTCRRSGQTAPERQVTCVWCGREFTSTDKREKRCRYCRQRDFRVNIPAMQEYCRKCERSVCLRQNCPDWRV